jgi:hypothetical protein
MKLPKWILKGLLSGLIMFVGITIILPLIEHSEIQTNTLLFKFVGWMVLGIGYDYSLKKRQERLDREQKN